MHTFSAIKIRRPARVNDYLLANNGPNFAQFRGNEGNSRRTHYIAGKDNGHIIWMVAILSDPQALQWLVMYTAVTVKNTAVRCLVCHGALSTADARGISLVTPKVM